MCWFIEELEATASWDLGERSLLYVSVGAVTSIPSDGLLINPASGVQIGPRKRPCAVQVEATYFGVNQPLVDRSIQWVGADVGAIGGNISVSRWIGETADAP